MSNGETKLCTDELTNLGISLNASLEINLGDSLVENSTMPSSIYDFDQMDGTPEKLPKLPDTVLSSTPKCASKQTPIRPLNLSAEYSDANELDESNSTVPSFDIEDFEVIRIKDKSKKGNN